jgi:tetratricopeptide (TPR) repeat protein
MADAVPQVPTPSFEQRRVAAAQYERANQVIRNGDYDYGIQLLLTCCKIDPANLIYRNALRQAEKVKYKNNLRGSRLASVSTAGARLRLRKAALAGDYLRVLEHGEAILVKNPWDVGANMALGEAFEALGLLDPAVWSMEQARLAKPRSVKILRALARLYEKRGNFTHAAALWDVVRKADPKDTEAQHKAKDLAANETIARGRYEEAITGTATHGAHEETSEGPPAAGPAAGSAPSAPSAPAAETRPPDRIGRQADVLRAKIEAEPTNANHYLQLAGVYRRAERPEEAQKVLEQGLGPTGNHFEIAVELADLTIESFRRDLTAAEQHLRARPDDEELRRLRVRLLKEVLQRELELYRRKADRYPTEMAHRLEIGVRLLRLGQIDEAIRELQMARSDPRQLSRALLYLGYCFKARNNWRLAQRNFEEALKGLPPADTNTRKELLYELARGHADAGSMEQAVELAYELANLDFGYRNIGQLLDEWQARLQQGSPRPR